MESVQAIFHRLHQMVALIIINTTRISPQLGLNFLPSSATTTTQQYHHLLLHHNYYNNSNRSINNSNFKISPIINMGRVNYDTTGQMTNMGRGAGYDTSGVPKPLGPKPAPKPAPAQPTK